MKHDAKSISRRALRIGLARAPLILAGALLAVGGCAPTWNLSQPQSEAQTLTPPQQLTSGFDAATHACFFPNLNWITFRGVSGSVHEGQLYVAQLRWEGGKLIGLYPPVRITPPASDNGRASFSPDGNSLIFASTGDKPAAAQKDAQPSATPDEALERWAFRPEMEIYRADGWQGAVAALAPGGSTDLARHALTHNRSWDGQGSYSPDGRWIIFTSTRQAGVAQLYVMEADGTHPLRLTHTDTYAGDALFSPDGNRILYRGQAKSGGPLQIFCADVVYDRNRRIVGLASPRQLTDDAPASKPAWHPDGKHVFYAMTLPGGQNEDIYLMRADGSHKTRLTLDPAMDGLPVFSPDGRWLMWTSTRSTDHTPQLFIARFTMPPGT